MLDPTQPPPPPHQPTGPAAAAARAFARGRPLAAAILQVQEVNWKAREDLPNTCAKKLLGIYMWHAGDLNAAKSIFESLLDYAADDPEIPEYLGMVLMQLNLPREAASYLLYIQQLQPERADICEALAQAFLSVEDRESSKAFDDRAKELRAAEELQQLPMAS